MRWRHIVLIALPLAAGCTARDRIRLETSLATTLVSPAEERALGEEIHAELERQGVRWVRDPRVRVYVEAATARVLATVRRTEAVKTVHVHVIDAPDVVNAFATPGGHVFVFSGLLLGAENEAEVAGVLAHEIAHLAARHPARRLVLAYGAQSVAQLALGQDPALLQQIAGELVAGGVLAANSRSAEEEADALALTYLHRAGWDPRGLVGFLAKLQEGGEQMPGFLQWLSTHPTPADRVERLRAVINARGWAGGETGEASQRVIRRRLRERAPGS